MSGDSREEISAATGFDRGETFGSAEQVRAYFTVDNMVAMFGLFADPELTQDVLDAMADAVIDHRWHWPDYAEWA